MEAALQVGGTSIYVRRAITALALGGSEGVGQLAEGGKCSLLVCVCGIAGIPRQFHTCQAFHTRPPEIYSSSLVSASQKILA